MAPRLTKSTFVTGVQCPNLLWWETHEPDSPELCPTPDDHYKMEQGTRVATVAREHVPGGVLIRSAGVSMEDRLQETITALEGATPVIYQACFQTNNVFVAVDILERTASGALNVIEVTSSTGIKNRDVPGLALQAYALAGSGLEVARCEVMHLNPECRHPDLSNLFVREDVTPQLEELVPAVETQVERILGWLDGDNPQVPIGEQCFRMDKCAFRERCWPKQERDHVFSLAGFGLKKTYALMQRDVHLIDDLPADIKLSEVAQRQVRAVKRGTVLIEPALGDALHAFAKPLAYLDFESVGPAIPVWPGCRPWDTVPAQFSCHAETGVGGLVHHEWIADGPSDPREPLARALIEACRDAESVMAYYASVERGCIAHLETALPHLADELASIRERIVDLHPVVKDYVYHPDFLGSFGLKSVVPALVPELAYDDLAIADGLTASAELTRLMFEPLAADSRAELRAQLLAYCERDTAVMVALMAKLNKLAEAAR